MLSPSSEQLFRDWLEADAIVNRRDQCHLSPVISLSDLPDTIPEHDEYPTMPHSLRHLLTPPTPLRPTSILIEPPSCSRPRWSPCPDSPNCGVFRAQSVSSIGSCSTAHTRSAAPIKSILTRHDSGVSMATTAASTNRKKKRSPSSVKFVDTPTVYYDHGLSHDPPPRSPSSPPSERRKPTRWFTRWWKRDSTPPPRPPISGPYRLSYTASLVDVRTSTPSQKPGRLKQLWQRLTGVIG